MESHKAVFKQRDCFKRWKFNVPYPCIIYFYFDYGEWKDVWNGELFHPPLKEKDEIYIDELDKIFNIAEIIRTTNNFYWYYLEDENYIEDDETERTLEIAKQEKKEYYEKIKYKQKRKEEIIQMMKDEYYEDTSPLMKFFDKLVGNWPYGDNGELEIYDQAFDRLDKEFKEKEK